MNYMFSFHILLLVLRDLRHFRVTCYNHSLYRFSSRSGDEIVCEYETVQDTAYHDGTGTVPVVGDMVYSDSAGTTPLTLGNYYTFMDGIAQKYLKIEVTAGYVNIINGCP